MIDPTPDAVPLHCAAFDPVGERYAVGGYGKSISLWSFHTRQLIARLSGHPGNIVNLSFSESGEKLASGDDQGNVLLWNMRDYSVQGKFTSVYEDDLVLDSTFIDDDRTILVSFLSDIVRCDIETDTKSVLYSAPHPVHFCKLRSAEHIAVVDGSPRLAIVHLTNGTVIQESTVYVSILRHILNTDFTDQFLVWTEDGLAQVDSKNGVITPINSDTDLSKTITGQLSPDEKYLAAGGYEGVVVLTDTQAFKVLRRFEGHTDVVQEVCFSPDGKMLLTASYDGTARLWDVASGKERWRTTG